MNHVGKVGQAPKGYFVSTQGDASLPWYVYIEQDEAGTGGFFIYWSQSPEFDREPLFDNWVEAASDLAQFRLADFEWLADAHGPSWKRGRRG